VKVTLWGTRGSLASAGPDTARYGGNTSCVEVLGAAGTRLILDAGTGIRRLGTTLPRPLRRVDLLLTHLHMDHIQGLGFFAPLYDAETEVHIWAPASPTLDLRAQLTRYLSPPLFPIPLRDLPGPLRLHEVAGGEFEIGEFRVTSAFVCHPGPTVGYRIASRDATLAYVPDHEPALGVQNFPLDGDWTSGYTVAAGVDLLIHDAQYSKDEYHSCIGWGHSSLEHTITFAELADVKHLVLFHYDPSHDDERLDRLITEAIASMTPSFTVTPAIEGMTLALGEV